MKGVLKYISIASVAIICVYLALVGFFILKGGEDPTFYEVSVQALHEADNILIKRGFCTSIEQCNGQERIALAGIPAGSSITFYEVNDPVLLNDLVSVFVNEFQNTPTMRELRIEAFPFSSREYARLHFWQYFSPWVNHLQILNINMKRRL
jgi:hypothetical protein